MSLESENFLNTHQAHRQMNSAWLFNPNGKNLKLSLLKPEHSDNDSTRNKNRNLASKTTQREIKKPHPLESEYRGQIKDPSFFNQFSESFNLLESFIKAQSANDLLIALTNLGRNLETNFQRDSSAKMLEQLNSPKGKVFLDHKIQLILNDTIETILKNPYLKSSKTENGTADDDLTKTEGNIATQNLSINQSNMSDPRNAINNTDQKLSSVILLFDTLIASGLKDSARKLLLGLEKSITEKLEFSPLPAIYADRPFMILDTLADPKKSGIELESIIDYSSQNSLGDQEINLNSTLKSFKENYMKTGKLNREPVDKQLKPYLHKLIEGFDYQHIYPDAATEFYLKAFQKGYKEEANNFLSKLIESKFKIESLKKDFHQYDHYKEQFSKLVDILKWGLNEKIFSGKDFHKLSLSLIKFMKSEDKPENLSRTRAKYALLESFFDKLAPQYVNKTSYSDLIISNADETISKTQRGLQSLKKSFRSANDTAANNLITRFEKEFKLGIPLGENTESLSEIKTNSPPSKIEPSKEEVLKALKSVYINFQLQQYDEEGAALTDYDNDYDEDDDYYDEEGEEIYYEERLLDNPLAAPEQAINFLDEIPALIESMNESLGASLDLEKVKALGINLNAVTIKDLGLKSIGTVANEAFLEFKEKYLKNSSEKLDFENDLHYDRFNDIILKKLFEIHDANPTELRFILGTQAADFVEHIEDSLAEQDIEPVDSMRLLEIFVNRETNFYKNAPNREADGSFKNISDLESKDTITRLIQNFDAERTLDKTRELKPESKKTLNEIIMRMEPDDYASTSSHKIAFLYLSLIESNLKQEANILLYRVLEDIMNADTSKINSLRRANILPLFKYSKEKGFIENFENNGEKIDFNQFNKLLKYPININSPAAQKYYHQDLIDKIIDPKVTHKEILESLEILCTDQKLDRNQKKSYGEALMKRLLAPENLINRHEYLENNLPDLIRLASKAKEFAILTNDNFTAFKKHFTQEDLVRLTPPDLAPEFFSKASPKLGMSLESSVEGAFQRIKALNSEGRLINDLEVLLDKGFSLNNQKLTDKLILKLREELSSLEIEPHNAIASLSLLNCVLSHTHNIKSTDDNERLRLEYSEYLDLPLRPKGEEDEAIDLRVVLISKMEEALRAFERLDPTFKKNNSSQFLEAEKNLRLIGLPLYQYE